MAKKYNLIVILSVEPKESAEVLRQYYESKNIKTANIKIKLGPDGAPLPLCEREKRLLSTLPQQSKLVINGHCNKGWDVICNDEGQPVSYQYFAQLISKHINMRNTVSLPITVWGCFAGIDAKGDFTDSFAAKLHRELKLCGVDQAEVFSVSGMATVAIYANDVQNYEIFKVVVPEESQQFENKIFIIFSLVFFAVFSVMCRNIDEQAGMLTTGNFIDFLSLLRMNIRSRFLLRARDQNRSQPFSRVGFVWTPGGGQLAVDRRHRLIHKDGITLDGEFSFKMLKKEHRLWADVLKKQRQQVFTHCEITELGARMLSGDMG